MKVYRILIYESQDEARLQTQIKNSLEDGVAEFGILKITSYFLKSEVELQQKIQDFVDKQQFNT